jgi:hypothetical protein
MSTFEFLGQEFEYAVESPYDSYAWLEFCDVMASGDDVDAREANAAALRMALASVAKSDRARFQRLCRKENPPIREFMQIAQGWVQEATGRPTQLPSDSSDGHSDAPAPSAPKRVVSVSSHPAPVESRVPARTVVAARRSGLISA